MNNFFSNFIGLISNGRKFIIQKIDEKDKDLLSFSLLLGLAIGALHVIALTQVLELPFLSTPFTLALGSLAGSILYIGFIFAKSSLFYYLTGLYNKDEKPMSGRNILKVSFLSSYPFLLLPAAGILAGFFKSISLFLLIYFALYLWACIAKYKSFKTILKMHDYLFKLSYFIPAVIQFTIICILVAFAFISNFILIKALVENALKNISSLFSSLTS